MKKKQCNVVLLAALVLALALSASAGALRQEKKAPGAATHFHFLLDRSGSMDHLQSDVVGGFNGYIESQRRDAAQNPNDAVLLSLVQFDTQDAHDVTLDAVPVADVSPLASSDFQPRGGTPLYDAIARIISRAERTRKAEDERTVVIIFTDGEENSSAEHTSSTVAKLIAAKKEEGWAFVFLGANQDAYAEGGRVNIARDSSLNYMADSGGVSAAFASLSKASTNYRRSQRSAKAESILLDDDAQEDFLRGADKFSSETFFAGADDAQLDYEQRIDAGGESYEYGKKVSNPDGTTWVIFKGDEPNPCDDGESQVHGYHSFSKEDIRKKLGVDQVFFEWEDERPLPPGSGMSIEQADCASLLGCRY